MKTFASIIAASVAAMLLGGCGGASGASTSTDITVERGPLLYAAVTDAAGQQAQMRGYGVYRFAHAPLYPVTSVGGVIDVNRNNIIDAGDINATRLRLQTAEGDAATIVTSLAANAEIRTMLQQDFNLTEAQIFHETPSTDMRIAAISDEVYKYSVENNISDPSQLTLQTMETLRTRVAARIETYEAGNLDAGALEQAMVQSELSLQVMTQAQAQIMNALMQNRDVNESTPAVPDTTAASRLTDDQKYTLAYMWNEEKLAKDIYLALNDVWPNQVLYNIATRSETQHEAMVEALVEAYDINITDLDDYAERYSEAELRAFGPGAYGVPAVQALYGTLYAKGVRSAQDALEVGCMVEVTDINDLNEDIATATGADDLVAVFESLRSGSYNHYWAFDNALKTMGVSEGCCILGETFCKTTDEYPSGQGGKH